MKKLSTILTISLFAAGLVFFAQSCKKDPCEGVTCEYGGTPMAQDDECLCPCDDVECGDYGTPVGSGESCECDCDTGYEGDECETEMRAKFIASYSVSDDCVGDYDGSIAKSSTAVEKVIIKNVGSYLCNDEVPDLIATVDGSDITIEEQSFCSGDAEFTVKGSGSINDSESTVTLNYSGNKPDSEGGGTYSCSTTMSKK